MAAKSMRALSPFLLDIRTRLRSLVASVLRKRLSTMHVLTIVALVLGTLALFFNARIQQDKRNRRLFEALEKQDVRAVQALLEQGADPSARYNPDREMAGLFDLGTILLNYENRSERIYPTILMTAAESGQTAIAKILVEHGADITAMGGSSETAAFYAAWGDRDDPTLMRILLDRGARVNAKDNGGRTCLIAAAAKGNVAITRLLLDRGAYVDAETNDGATALTEALAHGRTAVARLLLERDADIHTKDRFGRTPREMIMHTPYTDLIPLVRHAEADR